MDLTFKIDEYSKFNVRTAALIHYQDNYFISKREDKNYYSLPGGRINYYEDSKTAILRELKEELNWDLSCYKIKLVRLIENFFTYADNTKFHEYLFIYEIEVSEEYFKKGNFINLENPRMHMEWYKKEDFLKLNIKPNIEDVIKDSNLKHLIITE